MQTIDTGSRRSRTAYSNPTGSLWMIDISTMRAAGKAKGCVIERFSMSGGSSVIGALWMSGVRSSDYLDAEVLRGDSALKTLEVKVLTNSLVMANVTCVPGINELSRAGLLMLRIMNKVERDS